MSFWIRRKDREGRRSLYLLGIPWEIAILVIGLILTLAVVLLRRFTVVP
jgi:hypothetical protein